MHLVDHGQDSPSDYMSAHTVAHMAPHTVHEVCCRHVCLHFAQTKRYYSVLAAFPTTRHSFLRASYSTAVAMQTQPPASTQESQEPQEPPTTPLLDPAESASASLTKSQLSRAAAKAVRLCTPADALYIVNSLHYSTFGHLKREALHVLGNTDRACPSTLFAEPLEFKPLEFGQPVSPRLSSHCFLHSLIRTGRSFHAARYAELMMSQQIRIRPLTLEAIVGGLTKSDETLLGSFTRRKPRNVYSPRTMGLSESHFNHRGNELAYRILMHARKFGQQRTERMYEVLVKACLLHGEIIAGSLLFVLLVKDWNTQQNPPGPAMVDTPVANPDGTSRPLRNIHIPSPSEKLPYPRVSLLGVIAGAIEQAFTMDPGHSKDDEYLQEPLQALANLLGPVNDGQYSLTKLSPLIRAMYSCPKTNRAIHIREGDRVMQTKGYPYFHKLLDRLLVAMKDFDRSKRPHLDTRTCNALLHYSLRHRLSPGLANDILEYMADRSLPAHTSTFNILIRSGTILRREDMSSNALTYLDKLRGGDSSVFGTLIEEPTPRGIHHEEVWADSTFGRALRRIRTEALDVPEGLKISHSRLRADSFTFISYLTYLTSTGNPRLIASILFDILPELKLVDHPAWGKTPSEQRNSILPKSPDECLRTGVLLGPHFFATLLNALVKAGETGLAERVWIFARQSERASWHTEFVPGTKPWCLPIHVYTSMMSCYANEARKGIAYREFKSDGTEVWLPKRNSYVRGWAHFLRKSQGQEESQRLPRSSAAKEMSLLLAQSLASGGTDVVHSLINIDDAVMSSKFPAELTPPKPDARFFNTALQLCRPERGMRQRSVRATRAGVRRFLRWANTVYYRHGYQSPHWNVFIDEIARLMIKSGYPLPAGFRHLFIGRFGPATEEFEPPRTLPRSPFAFPPRRSRFRAHSLPTFKTKGLPIRRVAPTPTPRPGRYRFLRRGRGRRTQSRLYS